MFYLWSVVGCTIASEAFHTKLFEFRDDFVEFRRELVRAPNELPLSRWEVDQLQRVVRMRSECQGNLCGYRMFGSLSEDTTIGDIRRAFAFPPILISSHLQLCAAFGLCAIDENFKNKVRDLCLAGPVNDLRSFLQAGDEDLGPIFAGFSESNATILHSCMNINAISETDGLLDRFREERWLQSGGHLAVACEPGFSEKEFFFVSATDLAILSTRSDDARALVESLIGATRGEALVLPPLDPG